MRGSVNRKMRKCFENFSFALALQHVSLVLYHQCSRTINLMLVNTDMSLRSKSKYVPRSQNLFILNNFSMTLRKIYVQYLASFDHEIWTRFNTEKLLEIFEIWCYRRMLTIKSQFCKIRREARRFAQNNCRRYNERIIQMRIIKKSI